MFIPMTELTPYPAVVAQARMLPQVLEQLASCTPPDSLERAELVERLSKLLGRFRRTPHADTSLAGGK